MSDLIQSIEDLIEQLVAFEKSVNKLKTASVSRTNQRNEVKTLHKTWLPISGRLEQDKIIGHEVIEQASQNWSRFRKLAEAASPKTSYKAVLKALIGYLEISILHPLIKRSGFKTVGTVIRGLLSGVTDATLTKYLEEAIICTEQNCVRSRAWRASLTRCGWILGYCSGRLQKSTNFHQHLTSRRCPTLIWCCFADSLGGWMTVNISS